MIETVILSNLVFNDDFGKRVFPYLKSEYFSNAEEKKTFELISEFVSKYNSFPTKEALYVDLSNSTDINEHLFKDVKEKIDSLAFDPATEPKWLIDQTNKFIQDKAVFNALMASVSIFQGEHKSLTTGAIPSLLQDALSVSLDSHIGHDYLEDYEERYNLYHQKESRIPFDIDILNVVTKGGFPKKTLNIWVGGPNVGKSLILCHCAASNLMMGKNVLYISLEMGEARPPSIAERIDANLLNVTIDQLKVLPRENFNNKINKIKEKGLGKLIIKEYPTASAGVVHFRALLNELKLKKRFVPDIIYVDYLNICVSSRLKYGQNVNSYSYIKAVGEELRGLGQEFDVPIVSATQLNRDGFNSSDVDMDQIADSFGTAMTADFIAVVTQNEMLEELGQYQVKQLKSRYANKAEIPRFMMGVDKAKMRLFDVEENAQTLSEKPTVEAPSKPTVMKPKFKGFK